MPSTNDTPAKRRPARLEADYQRALTAMVEYVAHYADADYQRGLAAVVARVVQADYQRELAAVVALVADRVEANIRAERKTRRNGGA